MTRNPIEKSGEKEKKKFNKHLFGIFIFNKDSFKKMNSLMLLNLIL